MSIIIKLKHTPLLLSICLLLISLTQDCYCTQLNCEESSSIFFFGWLGLYMLGVNLIWLANPILIISWLTVKISPRFSWVFSLSAAIGTLLFLFSKSIFNTTDEYYTQIINYRFGYWLWVASAWVILLGNTLIVFKYSIVKWSTFSALVIVAVVIIYLGLNKQNSIVLVGSGCEINYTYTGTFNKSDNNYILANRKLGLCICNNYWQNNDANTANQIIWFYNKYGNTLNALSLNHKPYPTVDSIVKYRKQLFDTLLKTPKK